MASKFLRLNKWTVPEGGGAPLLCQPNVPHPLHGEGCQPRTIIGRKGWDEMRRACYAEHDDTCEACGQKLCGSIKGDLPLHHCHEAMDYDYATKTATFKRLICLCPRCVDKDTEVLTASGWKKIPEVTTADEVACWATDESINFAHPTATVVTHPKVAIKIQRGGTLLYFSPEHRLPLRVASKQSSTYGEIKVIEAKDYKASHYYNWISGGSTIGEAELTPLERLYIAIEADGHLAYDKELPRGKDRQRVRGNRYGTKDYRYTYEISLGKRRKIERLEWLLKESGVKYNRRPIQGGEEHWTIWLNVDAKHFSECFDIQMSSKKALSFLEELVFWDGTYANGQTSWYTNKLEEADFVQAVACQCNAVANIGVVNRIGNLRKGACTTPYTSFSYAVSIRTVRTGYCGREMVPEEIEWHEPMYCLSVPTTFFVARRDGLVFVTGNCHTGVIHSGRAITMYKNHIPLWTKEVMLDAAEHAFRLVSQWNKQHPDEPKLRCFQTIQEWLEEPSLHNELQALIDEYEIEFYSVPPTDTDNDWGKWKLIYNDTEYWSPYTSRDEWREAMDKKTYQEKQENKLLFSGEEFDKLREMIGKGEEECQNIE